MRIWVIDTGLPGVNNQCLGLAAAIATQVPCEVATVRAHIRTKRLRGLLRWALRRKLIGPRRNTLASRLLTRLIFNAQFSVGDAPDVVITALGRSEYTAALLGGTEGAFAIHIGAPDNMPASTYNFLVLVNSDAPADIGPHVHLFTYPTPVLRQTVETKAATVPREGRKLAVFLGGNGAGYTFTARDWEKLASGIAALAKRTCAKLLITTSRRTGKDTERQLAANLPGNVIEDVVWYASAPRPVIIDYLARADIAFVTGDSRSMIADAIAAGKPVYAIDPPEKTLDAVHRRFLEVQEAGHRLRRVALSELDAIDVDADCHEWFKPLPRCWSSDFLEALFSTGFRHMVPQPETGREA